MLNSPDQGVTITHTPEAKRFMISTFTALLQHCANVLPFIAEYEDNPDLHPVWDACAVSFTTDFRALYGFMLAPQKSKDAHRRDFAPKWKHKQTAAVKRLKDLVTFIHRHRAHLSWDRYEKEQTGISNWVPPEYLDGNRIKAVGYARILSDYLDVLDEFIQNLPSKSEEQQIFFAVAFMARHRVNSLLGLPPPSPDTNPLLFNS